MIRRGGIRYLDRYTEERTRYRTLVAKQGARLARQLVDALSTKSPPKRRFAAPDGARNELSHIIPYPHVSPVLDSEKNGNTAAGAEKPLPCRPSLADRAMLQIGSEVAGTTAAINPTAVHAQLLNRWGRIWGYLVNTCRVVAR